MTTNWQDLENRRKLMRYWKKLGGMVHGPRTETVSMPEETFYLFMEGVEKGFHLIDDSLPVAFVAQDKNGMSVFVQADEKGVDTVTIKYDCDIGSTYTMLQAVFENIYGFGSFEVLRKHVEHSMGSPSTGFWATNMPLTQFNSLFKPKKVA
jgi:hypothetical protein